MKDLVSECSRSVVRSSELGAGGRRPHCRGGRTVSPRQKFSKPSAATLQVPHSSTCGSRCGREVSNGPCV